MSGPGYSWVTLMVFGRKVQQAIGSNDFHAKCKGEKINKIKPESTFPCVMLCPGLNQGRTYSFYQGLSYTFDVFVNRMVKYTAAPGFVTAWKQDLADGERRKVMRRKRKHTQLS